MSSIIGSAPFHDIPYPRCDSNCAWQAIGCLLVVLLNYTDTFSLIDVYFVPADGIASVHSQYGVPIMPQPVPSGSFDLLLHEMKSQLRKRSSV